MLDYQNVACDNIVEIIGCPKGVIPHVYLQESHDQKRWRKVKSLKPATRRFVRVVVSLERL